MKKTKIFIALISFFLILISCSKEDSLKSSQINTNIPQLTALDNWIRDNITTPYNIEIQYKWNENEVDINKYLYPPAEENVQPVLEALLAIWVDPYNQIGGSDFIKNITPRQYTLIGGPSLNDDGTETLGQAEGGTKITLIKIDLLDLKDEQEVKRFFETIRHEYAHILNQTKPFDVAYNKINPEHYTAQWFNVDIDDARELGFITNYALLNDKEDFAEMVATMLTNSKADFDAIVDGIFLTDDKGNIINDDAGNPIKNKEAIKIIRKKEQIVVDYFSSEFGIDLYKLQEVVNKNTLDFINL